MRTFVSDPELDSIVGAFEHVDRHLFRALLGDPEAHGDLAEIGVWYGQSAILIGDYVRDDETFTVIDLFGAPAADPSNQVENQDSYSGLTRSAFEANYLRFHDALPNVIQGFSQDIAKHARSGSHRFVHIDASHLFEHVEADLQASKQLLAKDGIIVFDDIRHEHTPGVAAAAWQAVGRGELIPFAISPHKLYTATDGVDRYSMLIREWQRGQESWQIEEQSINGHPVLRIFTDPPEGPKYSRAKRFVPEVAWPLFSRLRQLRDRVTAR